MPFNSKEKQQKWYNAYRQTDSFKYSVKIQGWKQIGIISSDWEKTYKLYNDATHCQNCNVLFSTKKERSNTSRCLDHDHSNKKSHNIRAIICHYCNVSNEKDSKACVMNIRWCTERKKWCYSKKINGIQYQKRFPYFIQAVIYKREIETSFI